MKAHRRASDGRAHPQDSITAPGTRPFYVQALIVSSLVVALVAGYAAYRIAFDTVTEGQGPRFDLSSLILGKEDGALDLDPDNPCIVVQEHLETMRRRDYQASYGYLSAPLRLAMSFDEFVASAKRTAPLLRDVDEYIFESYDATDGTAAASGYVVYAGGGRSRARASFVREEGGWRVASLTLVYE